MSKTFAVADLHGRHDLLEAALDVIDFRSDPGDTVVFLGDYVDRGPASRQIIETLMAWAEAYHGCSVGIRWICLQGNHEDMMVQTLSLPLDPRWWIGNGGGATLVSYGHPTSGRYRADAVPASHVEWLNSLPLMHADKHRIYVHAGVDPTKAIEEQTTHDLQWKLYPAGFEGGHGDRHVVHGHEQFRDGPKLFSGRTDLDTFAWLTGRLAIGVFEDDVPGGPVEVVEVQGAPDTRYAHEDQDVTS